MKRIISLAICVVFAFALCGCDSDSVGENSVAGFEYYHYEPDDFNKSCDKLEKLAASDKDRADQVIDLYDQLYDQCLEMDTLYSVAYLKHSINQTDQYYSDEQQYSFDTLQDCADRFGGICRKITGGPCADAFKEHVGKKDFDKFAHYEEMTKEQKALLSKENKLTDKYYDEYDKVSFELKGKKWTFDTLFSTEGDTLAENNYNGYLKVYDGLFKDLNKRTGPIFIDLLKLRVQEAREAGYDNYADYADEEIYHRDYSSEEIDRLHDDVKEVALDFYDIYFNSLIADPEPLSNGEIIDTLDEYSGDISKMAGKSCDKLIEKQLYSMGSERCRMETGYTTYLDKPGLPFIFDYIDGAGGFREMSHEFGHFVQADNVDAGNVIISEENIDLAEIASNGFECLMTHYNDEIYGSSGDDATRLIVMDMFNNIIDGSLQDEFQRAVYAKPDMTLDEINETYADIESEYLGGYSENNGYNWCYIPHNFESPLYYISYSVSGIASLQIWDRSQTDFAGAAKLWEKVIRLGCNDKHYLQVIDQVGMKKFTDKGAVEEICKPALRYLNK